MTETLAIVGDGLIGRSVQLAWRRRHPAARVLAFDRGDGLAGLADADGVVLAVPVDAMLDLLPGVAAVASRAAFVTDTGSTKRAIVERARTAGLARFVPGHPMAGGTAAGPATARADLFDGRTWFLLRGVATPEATLAAQAFVADLGARIVVLDDEGTAHDALVAAISHVPQVVATLLRAQAGEAVGGAGLAHSGGGFRDTTRLADSPESMWAPILATNAAAIAPLLRHLAAELNAVADDLGDAAAIQRLFARAHRFPLDQ